MTFKKKRPAKQQVQSLPGSDLDLSKVQVKQEEANRSVCIYGASDDCDKWKIKINKCGEVEQIREERDGLIIQYATESEALSAVKKLHGKKGANNLPLVVCRDLTPPILVTGHKQDLFVIRDVPDEISIPLIWSTLNSDQCGVNHMSFLPTSTRHVVLQCKDKEGQQALLEKSGVRLDNWRLKIDLWFEFCFQMTRRNLVLIENLPADASINSVKKLIGVFDGFEYIQLIKDQQCALIYCKSKDIVNLIVNCGQDQLKISLYQQTAGLSYMVFIDNLHETTKECDIRKHFDGCGNMLKVNVSLDQRTGLKRAVACFEEEDSVDKALLLNGTELLGQSIAVNKSYQKKASNAVFITNLHRGATGLHLCLIFQDCGYIESVHIPKQKNTVNGREAAVVVFKDAESIPKALEKSNKSKIRGMRLVVHREDPYESRGKRGKKKSSQKSTSEGSGKPSKRREKKDSSAESRPKKIKSQ